MCIDAHGPNGLSVIQQNHHDAGEEELDDDEDRTHKT